MDTPIVDFVKAYKEKEFSRFHMPGHKGHVFFGWEPYDITEIEGADVLHLGDGIITESEKNAASLFGAGATHYSTEGSSLCIKAMLAVLKMEQASRKRMERSYILAGRKKLQDVRANELPALIEKAKKSGLPEDAQAANDLEQACVRFEKKLYDLELTRQVAIQMAPQIRLVQNNGSTACCYEYDQ